MRRSDISGLASSMGNGDNPKALRVSLTKEKLSQLSVAKSHSFYELTSDQSTLDARPWRNSPKYFTQVLISMLALVKMSAHAKSGGSIEVMGMLTGKIVRNSFIVMDVYSLPVEGTETRVNAQNEAYEYMVQYLDNLKETKPKDSIVGWYHSHPGYGCWLSGIDVATQSLNQNFQDPYLAIVVDPSRTSNQGKVEIGAFRTFPVGYVDETEKKGKNESSSSSQGMGAHSNQYYALDVKLFKGPQDEEIVNAILDKSWVSGIAQTQACVKNYDKNVAEKVESIMEVPSVQNSRTDSNQAGRYERLFERMAVLHESKSSRQGSERESKESADTCRPFLSEQNYVSMDNPSEEALELDDDENYEGDDNDNDNDNDSESRIGLDNEDEDDVQSVRTRDADDNMGMAQDSDDASYQQMELEQSGEMGLFEEYEAGSGIDRLQRKGTKRNLRTSSGESKCSLPFGSSAENRKRFAAGDLSSAVDSELKHKMHNLQVDLQSHVKETRSLGQAELLKLVGKRAQQRVFGNRDW